MPRQRSSKWLSYEDAREFVQKEQIQSRQQFLKWYQDNKPRRIPKHPERVYTQPNEWTSWNDFLGTDNEFNKTRHNWRPFNEAVQWAHKQNIAGGKIGWLKWVDENEDGLPEDIPRRPDLAYKRQWMSWKHWLGDAVVEKVEAQQKTQSAAVFYIIQEREYSNVANVFTVGVETGGVSALKDRWTQEKFQVVRLYKFKPEKKQDIDHLINQLSSPYFGNNNVRAVINVHELAWELTSILDPIQ